MILAEFGDGDILLFILEVFFFVIWFWLLIVVFGDLFRDHELSGWAKAIWVIVVVLLPYLGILIYLIARGGGMAQRSAKQMADMQQQFDSYVKATAASGGGGSSVDQIAQAKTLLDSGAISQAEFDSIKAKALAG
jgi:hypothetical protein